MDDDGDGVASLFTSCDSLARWGDVGSFTGVVAAADAPSTLNVPTRLPNTTMAGHGADADRDGLDDLQVAMYALSGAETWLYAIGIGDWPVGQGAFTDAISVVTWPENYAEWGPSADLDRDGDDELTVYNGSSSGNAGIAHVWSP